MATLKEQLAELTDKQHKLAVWEAVFHLLDDQFITKDGRAAKAIRAPGTLQELVPEDVIDAVLQEIGDGPIAKLKAQIADIENRRVEVREEAKTK